MQRKALRYFVLATFAALTSGLLCLGREDPISPESLIAQALKLQDVWSDGTPEVKVRTEIEILDSKGKSTRGRYEVTWISPSRWSERLEIADYKRLRVHDSRGYWQQSTLSFQPEIIFQLDSILDFKTVLKIGAKQVLGKVKTRDRDGARQRCTEVKWTTGTEHILCFDEANGNLLSVEYPRSENQNPPDISRVEYGAFNKLGDKRIPYEVHAFRDRTVVLTAKILDVTPITEDSAGLFVTPVHSEFWPQCNDIQNPELVNRVQPRYPASARSNGEQGRPVFYAVIETDGTLSHLTLIQRATPALESAAADAIRQWHYKPAVCGSMPIRTETSIQVDFWLQR
jgi:TonB family protein